VWAFYQEQEDWMITKKMVHVAVMDRIVNVCSFTWSRLHVNVDRWIATWNFFLFHWVQMKVMQVVPGGETQAGDFEWWMKEGCRNGASLSEGSSRGVPGGRASWQETPKDVLSKALEWASLSIGALLLGNMEGWSFLTAFEIKRYSMIQKDGLKS
jgi:hypothetical protein